jgi:glucokinase
MSDGDSLPGTDLLAGVDVGGSSIAVLITDLELNVLAHQAWPTRTGEPDDAGRQVAGTVTRTCRDAGLDPARVAAVGVGVPGRVDPIDGTVALALNLGWTSVPLRDDVEALLGVSCSVENDVRAAARGLVERRVLGPVQDLVYISVGTGISAGVVLENRLHPGVRRLAGEIGHVVVDARGAACICGLRGCLETVASGPGIAARARAAIREGRISALSSLDPLTAADVYAAAASGDALALETVEAAGRALALVIYDLALTLDMERICLGGGVSQAGAAFLDPIVRELDRIRAASDLARELLPIDLVHLLPPGSDAGAWGAVLLARKGRTTRSVRDRDRKEVGERSVPSPLAP